MTKLEKHSNLLFAWAFLLIAVAGLIGGLMGYKYHFVTCIAAGLTSFMLFAEIKNKK